MKRTEVVLWCFLAVFLYACEQTVGDLNLPEYQSKIVIDGWIEQGQYAEVTLTRSASYFDNIDSAALREALVSTAKVSISDGENSEVLTLFRNSDKFPPFFYRGTKMRGEVGKSYKLTVESRSEVYEAVTSILPPPKLDSLWVEFNTENDSLANLWASFTDEPIEENYYRIFTQRKSKDQQFEPIYLSAIGDRFFDGEQFTFNLLRNTQGLPDNSNAAFTLGDTVTVRFCSMDRSHFDFWRTLERESISVGNPFSSSGNAILSNTGDNALGVWGGYGASYYRIIIK